MQQEVNKMARDDVYGDDDPMLMSEINTTPLVDVMLVLLVIFMITAPLFTHAVKMDLPQASSQANPEKPDTITLAIDIDGKVFWNNEPLRDEDVAARLAESAAKRPQPELHLRADRNTRYQKIAQVMAAAQNAGLEKIGFVTDPRLLKSGR
jgi:biopolymer transport protein ExbD